MKRNPAIEFYRILLMLGIVTLHTLACAGLGYSLLMCWLGFCVDGFVFISGWYGIRFGWKKLVRLYGLAFFCSAVYLWAKWFCFESSPWSTTRYLASVVHYAEGYWFINAYAVLMCFAPVVDAALESKQRTVFVPLLLSIFGWSFACMVPVVKEWVPRPYGFDSHSFLTLLGVYVVARVARLERFDEKISTRRLMIVLALLSALAFCNLNKYNSPVAVLMGGVLFVLFSRIPSRMIGRIERIVLFVSPSMLAVYLLHGCGADFMFIRIGLSKILNPWLSCLVVVPITFFGCLLIDVIRRTCLRKLRLFSKIGHRHSGRSYLLAS